MWYTRRGQPWVGFVAFGTGYLMSQITNSAGGRRLRAHTVEALESRQLLSATLLRDLAPAGTRPYDFTQAGTNVYFSADDADHGNEIWRTDGTSKNTAMLGDLTTGKAGTNASLIGEVNKALVFSRAIKHGAALMISDGTANGTKQLWQGPRLTSTVLMGEKVYFATFEADQKTHLWVSDGTIVGTKDLMLLPGVNRGLALATNGKQLLLFSDNNQASPPPASLYIINLTNKSTTLLKTFPAVYNQFSFYTTNVNGTLFFEIDTGQTHRTLWKTDGTASGTKLVVDLNSVGALTASEPLSFRGKLFFVGDVLHGTFPNQTDTASLWSSDGTANGTKMILDLGTLGIKSIDQPVPIGSRLYFRATDKADVTHLYQTDGTAAGTGEFVKVGQPDWVTGVGDTLFVSARDTHHGDELWKSDGTLAGTVRVTDIYRHAGSSNPKDLRSVGEKLYFNAFDPTHGREPYVSNGTPEGTHLLGDINPHLDGSADPKIGIAANGLLYFSASDGMNEGRPIFATDGTGKGIRVILDVGQDAGVGTVQSAPTMGQLNDKVLFFAGDGTASGRGALWITDGTSAGTSLVKRVFGNQLVPFAHALYFTTGGGSGDSTLYRTDGTAKGTFAITSLTNFKISSDLVVAGNRMFFTATDGVHGYELWSSDGTKHGTGMLKDIKPGAGDSMPFPGTYMGVVGKALYFRADDGVHGAELWDSDGTKAGTKLVADIKPGAAASDPTSFHAFNGRCFFTTENNPRLYKSDGTTKGTKIVGSTTGTDGMNPFNMIPFKKRLFYVAEDSDAREQLWSTDGTNAGTAMVTHSTWSNDSPAIENLQVVDGALYFDLYHYGASDPHLFYVSDGTNKGTRPAITPPSGVKLDFYGSPVIFNGGIFFEGDDVLHGSELYRADVPL